MKDWWNSLQQRERAILMLGAAAAVLIIGWRFAWQPLTTDRSALRAAVVEKRQMLADLSRVQAFADPGTGGASVAGQSMFVLIDQTAQASGLAGALTRARPNGANEINVTFSNASFDDLVAWLVTLSRNNGVYVDGASINSSRQAGLVSGQLLLRRS